MTQLSKVKQNIYQHKDKSCNLKKQKDKLKAQPGCVNCFFNCADWRGSTLAIYKAVLIIFPLNLQTITITLDVVKWRWGGSFAVVSECLTPQPTQCRSFRRLTSSINPHFTHHDVSLFCLLFCWNSITKKRSIASIRKNPWALYRTKCFHTAVSRH